MIRTITIATAAAAFAASVVSAAPVVSAVQGTVGNRQAVTILGSGFGVKIPAAPLVWADFNGGMNPGKGSLKQSWDEVGRMTWSANEGVAGGGCAKAVDGSGFWTLRTDYDSWTTDGQKMYLFKKEKLNFQVTSTEQNWKSWRMWPAGNGYPNIYAAPNNGRVFVEKIGGDGGFWGDFRVGHTGWSTQEIIFRASTFNQKNGYMAMRYENRTVAEGSVMTRSATGPAPMQWNYVVHGVGANHSRWSPGWSNGNRIWADDVYLDTTWARVMLGNAPTYAGSTRVEVQIPVSWGNGTIGIMVRTGGSFSQGQTAYLYVFDRDGSVNSQGYPVKIGAAGQGSPPDVGPQGPVASAGPDGVGAIDTPIPMRGTVVNGAASSVNVRWTVLSGPGRVTFTSTADPNTMARFSEPGDYFLQMTVSDGSTQSVDVVKITVIPSTLAEGAVQTKNFFNPNRGETYKIVQVMDHPGSLSAEIVDRTGQSVKRIDGGDRPAGEQVIEWDGRNDQGSVVASGIYVVIKSANGRRATSKVAVLK